MNQVIIFTDGSSRGNPGPGGWGAIVITKQISKEGKTEKESVVELGGFEKNTTNNRMELTAVIWGLRKASEMSGKVRNDMMDLHTQVYTDSSYVINSITKWIHDWKRNGWMTKAKKGVLNKDLWIELDEVLNKIGARNVSWRHVGSHIGIAGNERCDFIATSLADGDKIELYSGSLSGYQTEVPPR